MQERLDRFLVNVVHQFVFAWYQVRCLPKGKSDQLPIIVDCHHAIPSRFPYREEKRKEEITI